MTHFEKIKDQVAAASVEEMADILMAIDDLLFFCRLCAVGECDDDCKKHLLNWLNSPVSDE